MMTMPGVVMDLMIWYVPTVLVCRDRLVNTTKPQNVSEMGIILSIGRGLTVNTPGNIKA